MRGRTRRQEGGKKQQTQAQKAGSVLCDVVVKLSGMAPCYTPKCLFVPGVIQRLQFLVFTQPLWIQADVYISAETRRSQPPRSSVCKTLKRLSRE